MKHLIEHLARIEATDHYAKRFGKAEDDPHVKENVEANWSAFSPAIVRVLDELDRMGAKLPWTR